jgi:SAM-dependent methyltransferase
MDDRTVRALNAINQRFYRENAAAFDATRAQPWPGWDRVLPHAAADDARVLDVGCGNGRFGAYLSERWTSATQCVEYTGIDSCPNLLERARARELGFRRVRFVEADLMESDAAGLDPADQYSLIALFGVLHHVPGSEQRRQLLRRLAERLQPGGILALTTWRFAEFARFRDKIVPWSDYNRTAEQPLDLEQLEPGDSLLPWRHAPHVQRYCNFSAESETRALLADVGLQIVDSYREDGRGDALNCYFICRFSDAQPAPKEGVTVR